MTLRSRSQALGLALAIAAGACAPAAPDPTAAAPRPPAPPAPASTAPVAAEPPRRAPPASRFSVVVVEDSATTQLLLRPLGAAALLTTAPRPQIIGGAASPLAPELEDRLMHAADVFGTRPEPLVAVMVDEDGRRGGQEIFRFEGGEWTQARKANGYILGHGPWTKGRDLLLVEGPRALRFEWLRGTGPVPVLRPGSGHDCRTAISDPVMRPLPSGDAVVFGRSCGSAEGDAVERWVGGSPGGSIPYVMLTTVRTPRVYCASRRRLRHRRRWSTSRGTASSTTKPLAPTLTRA